MDIDSQKKSVNPDDILNIAQLSRLDIDERTAHGYAKDIDRILQMMQVISKVDTDDLTPLANIHEACQELRMDVANTQINRELNQSVAPAVEQGLYLVPQVIE